MPDPAPTPVTTAKPAAAPVNGVAPVEPTAVSPAPATEEPKEGPKEGHMLANLRQREKRLVEDQQRARRELEQERAAFAAERQEMATWRAERQAAERAAVERQQQELAGKDPLRWFQTEQAKKLEGQDRKIAELESKLLGQEREKLEARQQAGMDRELGELARIAKTSADERPHTAKYAEKADTKFRGRAVRIAREHIEQGVRLTNDEILDKVEEELAEEAGLWTDSGKAPNSAPPISETGPARPPANGSKPAQPTLTSARAGERVAEMTEAELAKLSPQERRARTLVLLANLRTERAKAAGK